MEPEKLLAAYFNSSVIGVCILDAGLRILAINNRFAEINGVPAADSLGKTVRQVLGDAAALVEPQLQRVIFTGEPVLNFEASGVFPARREAGQWVGHSFPIKDASGAVTRVGVVVVETTEQKRLEEHNRQLSGKLRAETNRLQMLLDIGSILASNWNVAEVFPAISARIRRVLHQEYAGFSLYDATSGLLVRQAYDFPLGKGLLWGVPVSTDNGPGGRSLAQRAPLIYSREQLQALDAEIAQKLLDEGLQSLCCVPLLRPAGPLGVLVLGSTRTDAFQPNDLTLLGQVGAQLAVAIENHRSAAEIEVLKQRLADERKCLEEGIRFDSRFPGIVGESSSLKRVLEQAASVAVSNATVLVLGETGTGKELVARAIHSMSSRRDQSFIKVNCAAIPTGLLESELFGHEKGAFTGAIAQKIGRMELANGGTLFLDEIGEIPLELQPKLLRAIQDQEFERLGSTHTIRVNLRLIAATNRDLARGVAGGQFRSDLFYRINVFPVRVPPLREHREDIPLLVRHFVRTFASRMGRHIETVPKETMNALMEWSWPGNVRELENLMERSVILSEGRALRVPLSELHTQNPTSSNHTLNTVEREHILRVLRETGGVISGPNGAAHRLGLRRTTLQSRVQRLKIRREEYSSPERGRGNSN